MSEMKIAGPPAVAVPSASRETRLRPKVLMVDDQPARLLTYEAMLSGVGVECVRAQSGVEALGKLLKQEFAVILLDVEMPEMDGFEVARAVREHPRLERTPIIFVTGVHVSELDRLKGYEVGAIDYISVPVVPEILRSKVALLVELHQRRAELLALNRSLQETRERAEADHAQRLAEKDAQLLASFELHPDQFVVILRPHRDERGQITDWIYANANTNAARLLGLDPHDVVGRRLGEVLGSRAQSAIARCTTVLETQQPMRYEAAVGEAEMMITLFAAGSDMIVSSAVDVSDRKRAAMTLREAERRNAALFENAPVAVAHNAMDGRFQYVNKAFCRLVGYSSDELSNLTWQQITHPDDIDSDAELGTQVLEGRLPYYEMEKRYIRKDGSAVWASLYGNFVFDDAGRPIQGVAIVLDITQRKLADAALRESRERLMLAKSAAQLGIHDWDIEANVVRWDERIYDLWGIDPATPIDYEAFASGVHVEDFESMKLCLDRAIDPAGDGKYRSTYRVVNRRDGQTRWIEAAGQAFFEAGRAKRLVGTVQDITEKKLVEQALKENDRRKDEFLAMLAHELRNPIAPIRNAAEVLSRLLGDEPQRASLVGMIQRQGAHLSRILDDLLDVARITQGRIELRREVVSVTSCVEHAMEMVEPLVHNKQQHLVFERTVESCRVYVDRVRLEQCIGNVLSNAAKYTDHGGQIHVRLIVESAVAVIEVRDSGIGIEAALLPHIFDLFAQGERTIDRSEGGLGIGLSVCKQLIEMQGGTVHARSDGLGRGSIFTLRIPVHRNGQGARSEEPVRACRQRRVLIVDDNRDAADSLAMCLQLEGHQTEAVYSPERALERYASFDPEIVLLDLGLPGIDGYEVARRLRAARPAMKLIALTGYGQDEDRQRTAAAGFNAHLVKPVDIAALRASLD